MKHIFRFEWLAMKSSGRFWITIILLPLIIGFSLYLGKERVEQQEQTIRELRTAETTFYIEKQKELEAIERGEAEVDIWWQNPANPLAIGQFRGSGKHVFLEPRPLAALSVGQLDIRPFYGKVTMLDTEPLRDNALENPFMQAVGIFDFAFVLVWLVHLFIIVFGYNILSVERELGTWSLLQSQPVSMHSILFRKFLFRFLLLFAIVVFSLLFWSISFGIDLFNSDGMALIGAIGLYIAFWFSICALLNVFPGSSAVNAVSMAGIWILFLLIIPALISMIAAIAHPVPSKALWITEQRAIQQAVDNEEEQIVSSWLAEHPEEIAEGEIPSFYDTWLQQFIKNREIRSREKEARLYFSLPAERQASLVAKLRPLSPPMLLQPRIEQRAGSDAARLQTLNEEMLAFQQEWNDFFLPRFQQLNFLHSEDFKYIPSP